MSPGVAAKKRFGGVGFALGCGCKDPKAVAVAAAAVAASSPRSGTEASTATTATSSRRARAHPSGSASTGTLTVPSASSSFLWEDADADGDEVEFKRASSATTPSFSGLLRELSELERSVKSSCARKSPGRNYFSPPPPPPPPPPLPSRPTQRRAVRSDDRPGTKEEGHGDFSPAPVPPPPPPPPPPLSQPVQRRAVRSDDASSIKEGHGDFSPPSLQVQTQQQHRRARSVVDKVNRQEGDPHFTLLPPRPLQPPPPLQNAKTEEDGAKNKQDPKRPSTTPQATPKHRKAMSCDTNGLGGGGNRLDGSVAVVKQSEDPLGDFRRSMLNMIVENGIVAGDELRELLRRFLALNAPRHHDAILRAFAEIWDEVFAAPPADREPPARQTAPRQRTPPRRRQPLPAWRV